MALPDIYADEMVEAFLRKGHFEHAGVAFLSIADEEILPAEIPIIPASRAAAVFGMREPDEKRRRGAKPLLLDSLYPGFLPASLLSPTASGRYGVYPLCMESSIAAMPARYVTHSVSNVRFTSRG